MDELTTLYRRLSKQAHPDMGPESERPIRTIIMQQINLAYRQKDIETLKRLMEAMPRGKPDPSTPYTSLEEARKDPLYKSRWLVVRYRVHKRRYEQDYRKGALDPDAPPTLDKLDYFNQFRKQWAENPGYYEKSEAAIKVDQIGGILFDFDSE